MRPDVAFFDPYPHTMGGAQMVTLQLTKELLGRGKSVSLVSTGDGELTRRAEKLGAAVTVVKMPGALSIFGHRTSGVAAARAAASMPVAWGRMAAALRPHPRVVHATDLRGVLLAGTPARALGVPVVWHVHQVEPQPSLNRIGGRLANRIVVPVAATAHRLPSSVAARAIVIPGGIPSDLVDAPGADFDEPRVVCAARLSPQKGVDVLIEAADLLRGQIPAARVEVFGSSQPGWERYAETVDRRIVELDLSGSVQLCGFVDRPSDHWRSASVYVQPSRTEGLPLAVLEAMTMGLPVVASDVGGLPEVVEHGRTGFLVPPDDPKALSSAIADLLENREKARRIGAAARQRVLGRFTATSMTDAMEALYSELG